MENDLINRQMAINTIMEQPPEPHYPSWYAGVIEEMPAAEWPKTGKWIKNYSVIRCSECKRSSWSLSFEDLVRNFNYCPNCGAKMKEGDLND